MMEWNVKLSEADGIYTKVVDGDGTLIADTYSDSAYGEGLPDQDEAEHNARLIAKIPEMIGLIEEFLSGQETLKEPYRNESICNRAKVFLKSIEIEEEEEEEDE